MGGKTPEHPTPSNEPDDPAEQEAWRRFSTEMMGHEVSAEGIEAADREMREREILARRFDLMERIFEFSDLLMTASKDFPDLQTLENIASAAATLVDPLLSRSQQLEKATDSLSKALALLDPNRP